MSSADCPDALDPPCGGSSPEHVPDTPRLSRGNPTNFPCASGKHTPPCHTIDNGLHLVLQTRPDLGSPNLLLVHRPAFSLWLSSGRPLPHAPCHSLSPSPLSGWGRDLITMYLSFFILSHSLVRGPNPAHNQPLQTRITSHTKLAYEQSPSGCSRLS
jgi:hypothetical protein